MMVMMKRSVIIAINSNEKLILTSAALGVEAAGVVTELKAGRNNINI